MAAETGSGKTGAFCIPILQIVHETLRDIREGKTSKVNFISSSQFNCLSSPLTLGTNITISNAMENELL